jgi:hypothetical protein
MPQSQFERHARRTRLACRPAEDLRSLRTRHQIVRTHANSRRRRCCAKKKSALRVALYASFLQMQRGFKNVQHLNIFHAPVTTLVVTTVLNYSDYNVDIFDMNLHSRSRSHERFQNASRPTTELELTSMS